jgi:F0F1-type ATP synthase membrane subunit b/b'
MAHPFTSHLRLFDKLLQEYAGIYASLETEVTELKAELKRERTAHAKTKEEHAEGQASFDRETAKFEAELRQERDLNMELRREIQVLSLRLHTNQKPQVYQHCPEILNLC